MRFGIRGTHIYQEFLSELKEVIWDAYMGSEPSGKTMVYLYWDVGEMISKANKRYGWGCAFIEKISKDLEEEGFLRKGFSARNLWYMKKFYETYVDWGEEETAGDRCESGCMDGERAAGDRCESGCMDGERAAGDRCESREVEDVWKDRSETEGDSTLGRKLHPLDAESSSGLTTALGRKLHPLDAEISWTLHKVLLDKCDEVWQREYCFKIIKEHGYTKNGLISEINCLRKLDSWKNKDDVAWRM